MIKIGLSGKKGHFIRYHFNALPKFTQFHICASKKSKLVNIIRLRFEITLDINGLFLLGAFIEARDTRVAISRSAHSRALCEATALRGSMELWEIHPRLQTTAEKIYSTLSVY